MQNSQIVILITCYAFYLRSCILKTDQLHNSIAHIFEKSISGGLKASFDYPDGILYKKYVKPS